MKTVTKDRWTVFKSRYFRNSEWQATYFKKTNGFVEGLDILVQSTHQLITDIPRVKIQDSLYFELKEVNKWSM